MFERNRVAWHRLGCRCVALVALSAVGASLAEAAETVSLEEIRGRWKQLRERTSSVYLVTKVKRKYLISPEDTRKAPHFGVFSYAYTEGWFATKGDKLYNRWVAWSELALTDEGGPTDVSGYDYSYVSDGPKSCRSVSEVLVGPDGKRKTRPLKDPEGPFGEGSWIRHMSPYIGNVMLELYPSRFIKAPPPVYDFCGFFKLPELLKYGQYSVLNAAEEVDGARCVVLGGTFPLYGHKWAPTGTRPDRLWLDLEHGLAVRKREFKVTDEAEQPLIGVLNSNFEEAAPGFWLPRKSQRQWIAPSEGAQWPERYRGKPVFVESAELIQCAVNEVPDVLFDVDRYGKPENEISDLQDVVPLTR